MAKLKYEGSSDGTVLVHQDVKEASHSECCDKEAELIPQLCYEIKTLFRSVLVQLKKCDADVKSQVQIISLERSYSYLVLWSDTCFMTIDGKEDTSIAPDLKATILRYLTSIGDTLLERGFSSLLRL